MFSKFKSPLTTNYKTKPRLTEATRGDYILLTDIKQLATTKKSLWSLENKKYTFLVSTWVSKPVIKLAVEEFFNVQVQKINTSNLPIRKKYIGKSIGFKTRLKKAVITLDSNDKIALFSDI